MTYEAVIEQITADQFRVPSSRQPGARFTFEHNVLLRIVASATAGTVVGVGEANPRLRVGTYDHEEGSWRFLTAVSEKLIGATVGTSRADVETVMDNLRDLANSTASRRMRQRSNGLPYRGMLAGLDIALTGLAAGASGRPVADLLGGARRPLQSAAIVPAGESWARVRTSLQSAVRNPVVKLAAIRRADRALRAIRESAALMPGDATLWLEMTGGLSSQDAQRITDALHEQPDSSHAPSNVMLAIRASGSDNLKTLRMLADGTGSDVDSEHRLGVMAEVAAKEEVAAALDAGVRAMHFTPQRAGGALAVLQMAEQLHTEAPDVRIGLSPVPYVSHLGARAAAELAGALPRLDYCALLTVNDRDSIGSDPPLRFDERHRLIPDVGTELGAAPVLTHAVGQLHRHLRRPKRQEAVTYLGRPANRFDDKLLQPLTKANGSVSTYAFLERAALVRGLDTSRFRETLLIDHSDLAEPFLFTPARSSWTGASSHTASVDKEVTRQLLEAAGVPVPQGATFQPGTIDEAVGYGLSLQRPVVVKPRSGIHGEGVTVNLQTAQEIRDAIELLAETQFAAQPFIVETYIPGDDYRVLVVGDRAVSVVLKKPASVVGNGQETVTELVLEKNRLRLANPQTRAAPIVIDHQARNWLARQKLSIDSVPADGQQVRLGSAGNIGVGGESIEVLDETHESMLDLAVQAVWAVPGLDSAGVDVMGDHRGDPERHRAAAIEVNGNPAVSYHHFPLAGTPRDVCSELLLRACELVEFEPGDIRRHLDVRVEVQGNVQAIGYRQWFARLARTHGATGSIRNLPDGRVEAIVSGPAYNVWAVSAAARRGPRRGAVTRVDISHVTGVEPMNGFEVRG